MGLNPGDSQPWFLSFKDSENKIICLRKYSFSYFLLLHNHLARQDLELLDPPRIHSCICRYLHCTLFCNRYMLLFHILKTTKDLEKEIICLRQYSFSYLLLLHNHLASQDLELLDHPYIHSYICRHLHCTLFLYRYILLHYMLKKRERFRKRKNLTETMQSLLSCTL